MTRRNGRLSDEMRDRLRTYASLVLKVYRELPKARGDVRMIASQMIRSGTSVTANSREANRARSRAEFVSKIDQCAQEADETDLWVDLLKNDCGQAQGNLDAMLTETNELIAIFTAMSRNTKERGES